MKTPRFHSAAIVRAAQGALVFVGLLVARAAMCAPILPDFGAATFDPNQSVDASYFPMTATGTLVYAATEDGQPIDAKFEHTNQGLGPILDGVQTYIQRDRDFEDGLLVEDTRDYFAQDTDGNVWYFGEDSTVYSYDSQGNVTATETTGWHAGENGASPGFIMPVDQTLDFNYYQEFAQNDDAVDQAMTYALLDSLTVDGVTYENVLRVLETTDLEHGDREFKYYAPGVGLIFVEEGLDENLRNPETVYSLQVSAVPEPATFGALMVGLTVLGALRRRRWAAR
jgi:hypothetical protein